MSIIYVASIGQTAALQRHYWDDAKAYFHYTESVIVCGQNLVEQASRFLDSNANLVVIQQQFRGADGYVGAVKDIAKQVMDIVDFYEKMGQSIDEIVVNTAGGTEKMSCIIKDALDLLRRLFPYVTHVWGSTSGYQTVYTIKPKIDIDSIYQKIVNRKNAKPEMPEELPIPQSKIRLVPVITPVEAKNESVARDGIKKKKKKHPRPAKIVPAIDPKVKAEMEAAETRRKQKRQKRQEELKRIRRERHEERVEAQRLAKHGMGYSIKGALNKLIDYVFPNDEDFVEDEGFQEDEDFAKDKKIEKLAGA